MKSKVVLPLFIATLCFSNYLAIDTTKAQQNSPETESVWQPFASGDGGFTVLMPGTPEAVQETIKIPAGAVELRGFLTQRPEEANYIILYSDVAPDLISASGGQNGFFNAVIQGIANNSGGTLLGRQNISLGQYPGRDLRVELDEGAIAQYKLYIVNQRLYQLVVITQKEEALPGSIAGFFDSFQLTTKGVPVATLENFNAELNQQLCAQNWNQAVTILGRMIDSLPASEASREQLVNYRIRIQGIADSGSIVPPDAFNCGGANVSSN